MKHADMIVTEVESLTLRDVAGAGSQVEVVLRIKGGALVLRLVARNGRTIRALDLRARDKARRTPFVSVPCKAIEPGGAE